MTILDEFAALAAVLRTITSPQAFAKVYTDPKEAVSLGEFPCAVLALAPQVDHLQRAFSYDTRVHDYTVCVYVFLGARNTPINELHSRALPWSDAIAAAINADTTLGGAVQAAGAVSDDVLFRYRIGPIPWADGVYFGLRIMLPVQAHEVTT